jgi:hypothetical protein
VIKQRGWLMLAAEAAARASIPKKEKSVAAEEESCAATNKIEGESVPAFGAGHGPLAAGILVL